MYMQLTNLSRFQSKKGEGKLTIKEKKNQIQREIKIKIK